MTTSAAMDTLLPKRRGPSPSPRFAARSSFQLYCLHSRAPMEFHFGPTMLDATIWEATSMNPCWNSPRMRGLVPNRKPPWNLLTKLRRCCSPLISAVLDVGGMSVL